MAEYYIQPPLCGVRVEERDGVRTLRTCLQDSGVLERAGADAFWARSCARLADRLTALQDSPQLPAVRRRVFQALYLDYDFRDEFAPQFRDNLENWMPCWIVWQNNRPDGIPYIIAGGPTGRFRYFLQGDGDTKLNVR